MGASPVTMPWPEVYMALQRGVMDGIVTTAVGIYKSGLHKITKYANMWPLAPAQPWAWVVNGESWSQLPKDLKPKVKQVFREITDETFKIGMEEGQKCLKEGASEGNVNIIYPEASEIQKGRVITKPVYQRWLDRCKKAGDPGDELLKKVRALLSEIRSK
jgi:TRAP-type C4-dicarboxylate transport system substrate-binding protein